MRQSHCLAVSGIVTAAFALKFLLDPSQLILAGTPPSSSAPEGFLYWNSTLLTYLPLLISCTDSLPRASKAVCVAWTVVSLWGLALLNCITRITLAAPWRREIRIVKMMKVDFIIYLCISWNYDFTVLRTRIHVEMQSLCCLFVVASQLSPACSRSSEEISYKEVHVQDTLQLLQIVNAKGSLL